MKNAIYLIVSIIVIGGIIFAVAKRTKAPTNENTANANQEETVLENENASLANVNAEVNVNAAPVTTNVNAATATNTAVNKNQNTNSAPAPAFTFTEPLKTANQLSTLPNHGAILPKPPVQVSLKFNVDLEAASTLSIMREGKEYGTDLTKVGDDKRTLSRSLASSAPDGLYTVNYSACTADDNCQSGYFQFAVERP